MILITVRFLALAMCFATITIDIPVVLAQDFPYLAPEAPEFDSRGNMLRNPVRVEQSSRQRNQAAAQQHSAVRVEPPVVPNAPTTSGQVQGHPVAAPKVPIYEGPSDTSQRAARQTAPPQAYDYQMPVGKKPSPPPTPSQPQPQATERQDCSQFPLLIASSRSEGEMQFTARRYLTCLMQNGLNADQARQQVINIIESTYRPTR